MELRRAILVKLLYIRVSEIDLANVSINVFSFFVCSEVWWVFT